MDVWKVSLELVEKIYKTTGGFPNEEKFGLTNQMRRAAISIPSNIAEGSARFHSREFVQFLYIAMGSLSELETQLIICSRLQIIKSEPADIFADLTRIRQMLKALIRSKSAPK